MVRRSELPRSLSFDEAAWQDVPEGSWWMTASDLLYPPGVALAMEWTPAALCQYLPVEQEVESVVAADSALSPPVPFPSPGCSPPCLLGLWRGRPMGQHTRPSPQAGRGSGGA